MSLIVSMIAAGNIWCDELCANWCVYICVLVCVCVFIFVCVFVFVCVYVSLSVCLVFRGSLRAAVGERIACNLLNHSHNQGGNKLQHTATYYNTLQ